MELDQPGAAAAGPPARPAGQAEPHPGRPQPRGPGPALGEDTEAVLAAAGYSAEEIAGAAAERGGGRSGRQLGAPASFMAP